MIARILDWMRVLFCPHPLSLRDYRFRWEGNYGICYEECLRCGKEIYP